MKKYLLILLVIVVIAIIYTILHFYSIKVRERDSWEKYRNKVELGEAFNGLNVLVAYFSKSNNTLEIAKIIAEKTGGTLYNLADENNDVDINKYDLIFIGSPVYAYKIPGVIAKFIEKNNFKNKKVVPFNTNGGNIGKFFDTFETAITEKNGTDCTILKGESFYKPMGTEKVLIDNKINQWINELKIDDR
jgi:flavodoxin